jgi:hypothetical protein
VRLATTPTYPSHWATQPTKCMRPFSSRSLSNTSLISLHSSCLLPFRLFIACHVSRLFVVSLFLCYITQLPNVLPTSHEISLNLLRFVSVDPHNSTKSIFLKHKHHHCGVTFTRYVRHRIML